MICDALSRKAASLDTGSTESSASSTISLITDPFFKVSLHIIVSYYQWWKGWSDPSPLPSSGAESARIFFWQVPSMKLQKGNIKRKRYLSWKKKKSCLLGIYKCSKLSKNLVNKFFSNALLNAIIRIFIILKYYNWYLST